MTAKELSYHGRPAKIERSKVNSRFWILYIKKNGKWVRDNIDTSKRQLEALCEWNP